MKEALRLESLLENHPMLESLIQSARAHLDMLCATIPTRAVGSAGNQRATAWFAETIHAFGFMTEMPIFDCMDWSSEGATITAGGTVFSAQSSPYALGCDVHAPLVCVSMVSELEAAAITGKVLLLHGEIAREQLMPKHFTFYNPEEHQHIYRLLETNPPAAIITATGRNPDMAGALYPFPMFEDGDFDIPSVYLTDDEGAQIARHTGQRLHLVSHAQRRASSGCNVIARKAGNAAGRIVVMAHIDAKAGTPGALDNAAGVVTLLLLAESLINASGQYSIEIVALNGEDYYATPGELDYLRRNEGRFDDIALGINMDGLGYIAGQTAYSLYECPAALSERLRATLAKYPGLSEGQPWYQGDHMLLIMQGRPVLALTSQCANELLANVIHTANDTPAQVDPARLAEAALALHTVIAQMQQTT
ncbi:MAG: M28 family peptidase [Anaerolineae bacterium]|nr:M28 family peptidase [Anaerolineae bacterium]